MRASAKAFVALCATASASPAAANLIVNGGFEDGVFGGGSFLSEQVLPGDTTLPGWTVGGAPVTWYENGFNLQQIALQAHNGDFALNLNDGSVRFVSVSQTIATLPSREYEVSYWIGNYSANNGPASSRRNNYRRHKQHNHLFRDRNSPRRPPRRRGCDKAFGSSLTARQTRSPSRKATA